MKNAIEMKNITMMFNSFIANDDINFSVNNGEIHALIGENGAGKSTLMSILFGMYKQTSGSIIVEGKHVNFESPIDANNAGIGMVHQHFQLVETFTVLENILLNNEITNGIFINNKKAIPKINEVMDKYKIHVDLNKKIKDCTVAEQQRVEIIKMLYKQAKILIFDEPTAVLTPIQIENFLKALKQLQKHGKTIIIISHKLDELKKVANRGTIIRHGKVIDVIDIKTATTQKLGKLMTGNKVVPSKNNHKKKRGKAILKFQNVTMMNNKRKILDNFTCEVAEGEIVAIAGVEGNGQIEIINAITGMQKISSGKITLLEDNA